MADRYPCTVCGTRTARAPVCAPCRPAYDQGMRNGLAYALVAVGDERDNVEGRAFERILKRLRVSMPAGRR